MPRVRQSALAVAAATALLTTGAVAAGSQVVASVAPLSPCTSTDNGDPDLVSTSVTPATVDVRLEPATFLLRVEVSDDAGPGPSSGIASVLASIGSRELRLVPAADGSWQHEIAVPAGSVTTGWSIHDVMIEDHAGNRRVYDEQDLSDAGLGAAVTVISTQDHTQPVLRSLHVSKTSVNTTRHTRRVHFTARVTDNVGVREVTMFATGGFNNFAPGAMHLATGTHRDGRWVGDLTIKKWQGTHTWQLSVNVADGRTTNTYDAKQLSRRHFPAHLLVRSRPDLSKPRFVSAKPSASDVDVRARDGRIVVTMHGADTGSGIKSVVMSLHRPGHIQDLQMTRVAGSRRAGTWRLAVPLKRCESRTGNWSARFFLYDGTGNLSSTRRLVSFHVRNVDILGPDVFGVPSSMTRNGPFTVNFTEDVTGLSDASAVVRGAKFERSSPDALPPAVAGSWSCQTSAGADVSCSTGPLLRATWTPAQPLPASTTYQVDFNPEHVLDLTDLAGNPVQRFDEIFFGPDAL